METTRFDQVTRTLGRTVSRRTALAALLAGACTPLLAADAGPRPRKNKDKKARSSGGNGQPRPPRGAPCDVCEKDGCPFTSLQPAIDAASPGDTIRICEGTYKSNPTISINKPLTLIGAGADETKLKGGGFVRVLDVGPAGVVTMQGITVTGGVERLVPRLGGAGIMVWDRGNLTLERCRVEDNLAAEGGGIAVSRDAVLTLVNSVVTDNTALTIGGGLLVKPGGTATLGAGSRVEENEARVWGGGVFVDQGTLTLQSGSRVDENTARFFGGGIFAGRNSSITLETGSRVTDNDAGDVGGGLYNDRATVTIADTRIVSDNDPDNCSGISGLQTANCVNDD